MAMTCNGMNRSSRYNVLLAAGNVQVTIIDTWELAAIGYFSGRITHTV